MAKEKAVLAYSGGLDTSVILKYMVDLGWNVIAFTANLGQESRDFPKIEEKAHQCGASDFVVMDARERFVTDFVFPAMRANAKYQGRYLLGTSIARPLTAQLQVEVAKRYGAKVLSHGATGKGNDQVRFEIAYRTLFPEAKIFAPWKDAEFLKKFEGRDQMIEYAEKHSIPLSQSVKDPWSEDDNLLHISHEAGILEDPSLRPPHRIYKWMVHPTDAPDEETYVRIHFEDGTPVRVEKLEIDFVSDTEQRKTVVETVEGSLELFLYLNELGHDNGIGLVDMVEDRFVGMKSRGVYETPGGTILYAAHEDLEGLTMDREVRQIRDTLSPIFATIAYRGFWFSPEGKYMRTVMDAAQEGVTGSVDLALYKGNVTPIGRMSPFSLYDEKIASMHEGGGYDPTKARGFVDLNALRVQTWAAVMEKMEKDVV